jgi:hypothetical protein
MEKKSVGLLELETAVLECFLEKTPLSPLGVKDKTHVYHCLDRGDRMYQIFLRSSHPLIIFKIFNQNL